MCDNCGDILLNKTTPLDTKYMLQWTECLCGTSDPELRFIPQHGKTDAVMAMWMGYLDRG